jgi:Fe-S-cluster containining protein
MKRRRERSMKIKRTSFPQDEPVLPWLSSLLDAYLVVDRGVATAIESEERAERVPACDRGCSVCCRTNRDIPVYPLELMGLSWFAAEKTLGDQRETLMKQLDDHSTGNPCPFLIVQECAIYPLRPMACRQFTLFGTPCAKGEDPYFTRPHDLLTPVRKHLDQAFFIMLSFHGLEKQTDRIRAVENGVLHRLVKNLQTCNWKILAQRMMKANKQRVGKAPLSVTDKSSVKT